MKLSGYLTSEQTKSMNDALTALDKSIADNATYQPATFVKALKDFQKAIPQ